MKIIKFVLVTVVLVPVYSVLAAGIGNNLKFEIYLTKNKIYYDSYTSYADFFLDTIALEATPFLAADNIVSYDTVNHIIKLKTGGLTREFTPMQHRQMFVVKANDKPVYCGFLWSMVSSLTCRWIVIKDYNKLNGLTDFQMQISTGFPDETFFHGTDPRRLPFKSNNDPVTGVLSNRLKDEILIYPNPASGWLIVETGSESIFKCEIFTSGGKRVKTEQFTGNTRLDLTDLQKGIYILNVTDSAGKKEIKKIVIET